MRGKPVCHICIMPILDKSEMVIKNGFKVHNSCAYNVEVGGILSDPRR